MKRNIRLYLTFVSILLLAAFAVYIDLPKGGRINLTKLKIPFNKQFSAKPGLDIKGGTHLEYQGNLKDIPDNQRAEAMNGVRSAIERRIVLIGNVQEPLVETQGTDRLIVELPGITNVNEAINIIGQTPFLEFREEDPILTQQTTLDKDGKLTLPDNFDPFKPTGLTGKNLKSAAVQFNTAGSPEISLQFDDEGKQKFAEITKRNLGKSVAIYLDGQALSVPTVQSEITNGQAIITGQFTVKEAKELVTRLNSGALPVPISLISQQNVGATLGHDSIQKSIIAGLIGLALIAVFMIVYYRFPGILAVVALAIYAALTFAVFKIGISVAAIIVVGIFYLLALNFGWVFGLLAVLSYLILMLIPGGVHPVTLTLAGIAGFILSIGMAVDANILIFERTKEELRAGKDTEVALADGFARAWPSIRDSNASSLITTCILYLFGTPSIKSFAVTLAIGIIISLFTALTTTETFLKVFVGNNILKHPWLFGASKSKEEKGNAHA